MATTILSILEEMQVDGCMLCKWRRGVSKIEALVDFGDGENLFNVNVKDLSREISQHEIVALDLLHFLHVNIW